MKKFIRTLIILGIIAFAVIKTNAIEKGEHAVNTIQTLVSMGKTASEVGGNAQIQEMLENPDPSKLTPEQQEIAQKIVDKYGVDGAKEMLKKAQAGDISSALAAYNSVK
jgi:hypothetical protein